MQGDAMFTWINLIWLEAKLAGEFGQHTKYRRLCVERNATTNAAKLLIAQEVVAGRWVGVAECWGNSHTMNGARLLPTDFAMDGTDCRLARSQAVPSTLPCRLRIMNWAMPMGAPQRGRYSKKQVFPETMSLSMRGDNDARPE
jgi:hypothetical protein